VLDRRCGPLDVVYVHRWNFGATEVAVQDDGKPLGVESPQMLVVRTRTRKNQTVSVTTSHEFHIGTIGLINFDGTKENLVAISARSPADPLQKTG
jgi:hypothetical protein